MASTFGIRILAKETHTLTLQIYLITSDFNYLPRTHGFGFLMLISNQDKEIPQELTNALNIDDLCQSTYENGRKYIKRFELTDFENFPIDTSFTDISSYPLDLVTGKFKKEDQLPQGTFTLEVHDPKSIAHIAIGDVWECTDADLWGASWYLEHKSEKAEKFYHLYQNEMGNWFINYGKLGTTGKTDGVYESSAESAEHGLQPKLRKGQGYELIYKNFDTPFHLEIKFDSKEERLLSARLVEVMMTNKVDKIKEFLDNNIQKGNYSESFGHLVFQDYKEARKDINKQPNWDLYNLLEETV